MFKWLHNFFYSDDPDMKVLAAMTEPEALMWQELLKNNGIPSMVKNTGGGLSYEWGRASLGKDFDLFVRQSDAERADEILGAERRGHKARRR